MKAVVVTGAGSWAVSDVADPTPGPGEVVVEMERCGICGTDLHVLDGEVPTVRYPVIPGHEFSARVVALGGGVNGPAVGAFVVVDPMIYCGHCWECRSGWTNLCANGGGLGTTADGAFALVTLKVRAESSANRSPTPSLRPGPPSPSRCRVPCTPWTAPGR